MIILKVNSKSIVTNNIVRTNLEKAEGRSCMEKVKWGVLGTADIARGATIPGMTLAEHCERYAIAGRKIEKAKSYQEEFGFRKISGRFSFLPPQEKRQGRGKRQDRK